MCAVQIKPHTYRNEIHFIKFLDAAENPGGRDYLKRNVDINEISDGKRYKAKDMVKADCLGCRGCCDCCKGMGKSIVLDPYDAWRLSEGLGVPFASLIDRYVELNVVDGIILPNLLMKGEAEQCGFLSSEGRCQIHSFRPGICRLFPLGRIYEENGFSYFLQVHECTRPHAKVKVEKWVDIPNFSQYERFIMDWHNHLATVQQILSEKDEEEQKQICIALLKRFYLSPYESEDFYAEFLRRC